MFLQIMEYILFLICIKMFGTENFVEKEFLIGLLKIISIFPNLCNSLGPCLNHMMLMKITIHQKKIA